MSQSHYRETLLCLFKTLNNMLEKVKEIPVFDSSTSEYRFGSVIMDIALLTTLRKNLVCSVNFNMPTQELTQ